MSKYFINFSYFKVAPRRLEAAAVDLAVELPVEVGLLAVVVEAVISQML